MLWGMDDSFTMLNGKTMQQTALFVINSLAGGGAERVMTTLLRGSEAWADRFAIHLALLDDEASAYEPPAWVELHQLDCRKRLVPSAMALRALVRRLQPDITLSFLTRANVANAFAHLGARGEWVISERVHTSAHLGERPAAAVAKTLVRWTYKRAAAVIAVSEGVAADLESSFGVPPAKLRVLDNPVDLERIRSLSLETPEFAMDDVYVMAMGRLVENKNFALLIRAFAASDIDGKLLIVGEGGERPRLEQLVRELGLAGRVVMRHARMFVLPSNAEGFPNSLVEAMAVGCPVISTNCHAGPSQILAGKKQDEVEGLTLAEHGILCPTNDPILMAQALDYLQLPEIRSAYAAKATARADAYGADRAVRAYWRVLEEALGRGASGAGRPS
jgi:N-acetylgalactosamine-N,N'-diacetylbacillosaminyl-diphospho-undecaprenol 4-alpha-N-acetylgalactosaminyltransferase